MISNRNKGIQKFNKFGLPYVVAKCAQTLDGKIATKTGDSKWITSDETRAVARARRDSFDAILVGINTVLKDNPGLNGDKKKKLKKVVVDSSLKIPARAKLFEGGEARDCILATTAQSSSRRIHFFQNRGIQVILCHGKKKQVSLRWLFKYLAKQGIRSILLEGGARVIASALEDDLVDEMHIYLAPKILGDQNALSSIVGLNISRIRKAIRLNLVKIKNIGNDIFIRGYVHRNH